MLTSENLLTARFAATKFREGYDVVEVDNFLDKVVVTLRHWEGETAMSSRPGTLVQKASFVVAADFTWSAQT